MNTNDENLNLSEKSNASKTSRSIGKAIYKHTVASIGALLIFAGAFLAVFGIPPMLSDAISSSRTWMMVLVVLGILLGLVAAVLSYRATLKTYAE